MTIYFPGGDVAATAGYLRALAGDLQHLQTQAPSEEQLARAPLIDDWSVSSRTVLVLKGRVSGHPLLPDCRSVTSELFALDGTARWARTFSRFYILGTRAEQENS